MRRVLSLVDLIVLAAASIGPAFSLATTFGPMVSAAGERTPLALLAITAVMACVAVGYRRLGERFADAGSSYTWIREAFGRRAGAYGAWILLVANLFAILATAIPAGAYTISLVAPRFADAPSALGLVGALWIALTSIVLYLGMRPTARVTFVLLAAELLVLAASAVAGFAHPAASAAVHDVPRAAGFATALAIGIWMLDGWEISASTAEESAGGASEPGSGGLTGLLITAAILLACSTAFLRIGTPDGFSHHEADAMAYVGVQLGGAFWGRILTLTVLVSLAASLQTTLVYLTRSIYAMGRDGVLPGALGALDRRSQPAVAILLLAVAGIVLALLTAVSPTVKAAFDFVLSGTSFFLGVLFLMSAASAVRIFARDAGRPADAGRERWSGVAVPAVGAVALVAILGVAFASDEPSTRTFIAAVAAIGIPFAWWRGRTSRGARDEGSRNPLLN